MATVKIENEITDILKKIEDTNKRKVKMYVKLAGERIRCKMLGISWIHWKINSRSNRC